MNKLIELLEYGQSYWLDNLSRKIINNGDLKNRVSKQGLRGITSNPSIFNESISNSDEYDEVIKDLVLEGKTVQEIYDAITIKDVQDACDILYSVYKQSKGIDGFVSLEVRPGLARDTEGTITEVKRLYSAVGRKNCMIKIPGTLEGIAAIEQTLYEGININITLLFSLKRYNEVSGAYIKALKRRLKEGKDISNIISVASFFLSRIDTLADQLIGQHIITNGKERNYFCPEQLFGKVGTASAVLAYQQFNGLFESEDWLKMKKHGANVQRLLWASTSNKDPFYCDLRYVEPLIGPNTINTLPEKTIKIFTEHGQLKKHAILSGLSDASQVMELLEKEQINLGAITQQLEDEGIKKFSDSFLKLMSNLATKRSKILNELGLSQVINAASFKPELNDLCSSLDEKQIPQRMFAKIPGLWKTGKEEMKTIKEGLGWLNLPEDMLLRADQYTNFADIIKREKYESVVLLGMGGSSLCSEVARETFGSAKNYPRLYVLDNTDTVVIKHLENKLNLERTLFIVASKSGVTLETDCFFRYFYNVLFKKIGAKAGRNFIAITDKGTSLVKIAAKYKFRKVFINLPDIGGRYSVLSDFGILPMALVGIDIKAFLMSAKRAMISCGPDVPSNANPGILLGALLGLAQRKKCDKVTFVLSDSLKPFGFWVEQLLAESTGKEGKGLIPVNGEKLDAPSTYNNDRIFVHMYLNSDDNLGDNRKLKAIERAGFPVVRICIENVIELGGVYYYWEVATAIAGMIMGINPFDQPNVAESKNNTNNILNEWVKKRSFSKTTPILKQEGIEVFMGKKIRHLVKAPSKSLDDLLRSVVDLAKRHDYIAILPYFELTAKRNNLLQSFREKLRSRKKVATTLLNGPRYLHSTGQLHKGGPDSGLYILLTCEQTTDINIPGQKYSFETLHQAQALGDFRSLDDKGRRVIRIHFGKDIDSNLAMVCNAIKNMKPEYHEAPKN